MVEESDTQDSLADRFRAFLAAVFLATGCMVPASAPGADAHVHGTAVLEVSVSTRGLLVALRGPAQVFYGFEHRPATREEAAVVREAVALLAAPDEGLIVVDADCAMNEVILEAPFADVAQARWRNADGTARDEDSGHQGHEDDESHEGHAGSEGREHREDPGGHADLAAQYSYRCTDMPSRLTVRAFASFPALEYVEAAWISDTAAGSERLTARSPRLELRPR
jgi:hypothetical protein